MVNNQSLEAVRLDKWLWSVRLYKNRGEATAACNRNEAKVDGQVAKASRMVRIDMIIDAKVKGNDRKFKITKLAQKPVGNDRGHLYYEDLSDPDLLEDLAKQKEHNYNVSNGIGIAKKPVIKVQKAKQKYMKDKKGRATKKEKRDRDRFFDEY